MFILIFSILQFLSKHVFLYFSFEISVDMLDYMDEVLELQHLGRLPTVFIPCEKYRTVLKSWDFQK